MVKLTSKHGQNDAAKNHDGDCSMSPIALNNVRRIAVFAIALALFAGSVQSNENTKERDDYIKQCLIANLGKVSKDYCECVVHVSESLTENEPILEMYLVSANEEKSIEAFNAIVNGQVYNGHNFQSVKEKKEFIQGKGRLFLHRLDVTCKESQ